jgi:hypothetical protein
MRRFAIALVVSCVLGICSAGSADAVGFYVVGKEDCQCSPLVARGIVPDTLNKLKEAFFFPQVGVVLENFASEVRAMLYQAGSRPTLAEEADTTEEPKSPTVKDTKEKKKEVKKRVTKMKPAKKKLPEKKKRVPQPPRAM